MEMAMQIAHTHFTPYLAMGKSNGINSIRPVFLDHTHSLEGPLAASEEWMHNGLARALVDSPVRIEHLVGGDQWPLILASSLATAGSILALECPVDDLSCHRVALVAEWPLSPLLSSVA